MGYANGTHESSLGSSTSSSDLLQTGRIGSLLNPTHLQCKLLAKRSPTDSFSVYQTMKKMMFFPRQKKTEEFKRTDEAFKLATAGSSSQGQRIVAAVAKTQWCRFLSPALEEGLLPATTGSQNHLKNSGV